MTTISEDYVSDETFKLLKEKGFDDSCCRFVVESDETYHRGAPTLQMTMKWLREVHNINIDIVSVWNKKRFEYQVFIVTPKNAKHCYIDGKLHLGHEEACEEAIKYCLKHLI